MGFALLYPSYACSLVNHVIGSEHQCLEVDGIFCSLEANRNRRSGKFRPDQESRSRLLFWPTDPILPTDLGEGKEGRRQTRASAIVSMDDYGRLTYANHRLWPQQRPLGAAGIERTILRGR
jgi:hypothetical protein